MSVEQEEFITLCKNGNILQVEEFLKSHDLDLNFNDINGNSPLHFSAKNSDVLLSKLLIAHGADPEAKNHNNLTPLDESINSTKLNNSAKNIICREYFLEIDNVSNSIDSEPSEYNVKYASAHKNLSAKATEAINQASPQQQVRIRSIKKELLEKMKIIDSKKIIVERLVEEARPATSSESDVLNVSYTPSSDVMALILEAKSTNRMAKTNGREKYQPLLLESLADKQHFGMLSFRLIAQKKQFHFDCVLKQPDNHHVAFRMDYDGKKVNMFYFDAINFTQTTDENSLAFFEDFKRFLESKAGSHQYEVKAYKYDVGYIQKNDYDCAIFSLQELNIMSKLSNLQEYIPVSDISANDKLRKGITVKEIMDKESSDFSSLHPKFVKHIQGSVELESYIGDDSNKMETAVKGEMTLKEHVKHSTVINLHKNTLKTQNRSIDSKTSKYLRLAFDVFNKFLEKDNGVSRILEALDTRKLKGIENEGQLLEKLGSSTPGRWLAREIRNRETRNAGKTKA